MRFTERMTALTAEQRLHFYEVLAHNLTVAIRGVWSDETIADAETVERIKWVNEILHWATAKVWVLRLNTHEWTEEDFGSLVAGYVADCPGIAGEVRAALNRSYRTVVAEDMARVSKHAEAVVKPVWLIEAGVYGAEADPLMVEIRRQGMATDAVPHRALRDSGLAVGGRVLADGDPVIGYGTFPFARQIQLHRRWVPGAWCDPTNLDCTTYFAYFGKFLLNQHYTILPGVEAIRQRDWLFGVFGRDGEVFARPTCCQKVFTGRCMDADTFAAGLSPTRYDPATLVVVAAPRVIGREWRLVVARDRVVAGCQYAVDGQKSVASGCPADVMNFAEGMLAEVRWRPDPIFMLDVAEADDGLRLVELNGFSCSWLYACDLAAVVEAASGLASGTG